MPSTAFQYRTQAYAVLRADPAPNQPLFSPCQIYELFSARSRVTSADMQLSWPKKDPPLVTFLVETLKRVETLEQELANLPADAQSDRAALLGSITELRVMVRKLVS